MPGSCDAGTFDGLPGSEDDFMDNGVWWDNCGTGRVDPSTGKPLSLELWTAQGIAEVDGGQPGANMSALEVVSREKIPSAPVYVPAPAPSEWLPLSPSPPRDEGPKDSNGVAITSDQNDIAPTAFYAMMTLAASVYLILRHN